MTLSQTTIEDLKDIVRAVFYHGDEEYTQEEFDEHYENAVTCGNFDDTYSYGYDAGEAQLARRILQELGIPEVDDK